MKVVTPEQMNGLDNILINRLGIPGIVLMENAAIKVFEEIISDLPELKGRKAVVFAGKGNNGGDAFAVSRHLHNKGVQVAIFIMCQKKEISGDAGINLGIIEKLRIKTYEITGMVPELKDAIKSADLLVDGIFGTGFKGEISGPIKEIIDVINLSGKKVISIDIPSGVNGATGKVAQSCIKASKTITLGLPKIGMLIHPGCEQTGDVRVVDIGIPPEIISDLDIKTNLIDKEYVHGLIPSRKTDANKSDFGKILIITGSQGMTGAGCLSGKAALRSGAGLVYLGVPAILASIYDAALTEGVTIPLEDKGTGCISNECIEEVKNQLKLVSVALVGPGLSLNNDTKEVVYSIIENAQVPLVLDADALNAVSMDVSVLLKLGTEAVITPHPGEMAKLAGISIKDVQYNRIDIAREFSSKWKVITVLKGSGTIVALPDGELFINPTGNSGMATAGTGDVLAGLIAGFIGQGMKPRNAAIAGVYIHGLAGDRVASVKGEHGLIAGDLVEELPYAIKAITLCH